MYHSSINLEKPLKKWHFLKNWHFWQFFIIYSGTVHGKELRSFALYSVHQDASFELSKTVFGEIQFFTIRGDPCDLVRPKNWWHPQKWPKSENKSIFVSRMTNGSRIQMLFNITKTIVKIKKINSALLSQLSFLSCHNLIFWVLSQFYFLIFVTI